MKKKKSLIYPAFFMLVLAFVLTFLLAYLNELTKPIVKFNSDIELKKKILYVFNIKLESNSANEISETFDKNIKEKEYETGKLYEYVKDGETVGYAVPFDGPGLWGSINGYIGVGMDKMIMGVDFIKQDETPGLGGRIVEEKYKEQYRGIALEQAVPDKIVINKPAAGGNIDGISGATQTSTFVVNMINEDLIKFLEKGVK